MRIVSHAELKLVVAEPKQALETQKREPLFGGLCPADWVNIFGECSLQYLCRMVVRALVLVNNVHTSSWLPIAVDTYASIHSFSGRSFFMPGHSLAMCQTRFVFGFLDLVGLAFLHGLLIVTKGQPKAGLLGERV